MLDILKDVTLDTALDCLKMLPFLFFAFLLLEAVEHHTSKKTDKILASSGRLGPLVGALLGCVPQCGFSVFAANLYSGGLIGLGTLVAVFLSTSDEAVIIMLSHPESKGEILKLIAVKVVIAIIFGYIIMLLEKKRPEPEKHVEDLCRDEHCGCHDEHGGILKPALHHTVKIFGFLVLTVFVLNLVISLLGIDRISKLLLSDTVFQPFLSAIIGIIPNCASSIVLTELYLKGAISFASVISGLCMGAGAGLIVIFRENKNVKENVKIVAIMYACSVLSGIIISFLPI